MERNRRRRWGIVTAAVVAVAVAALAAPLAVATPVPAAVPTPPSPRPERVVTFEPPPLPPARYAIQPPSADPAQVRVITAADGVPLYTETWLPAALDGGEAPPARLPVVLVYTPYAVPGTPDFPQAIDLLVPRGYAVTFAHVRGSGASGGCIGLFDQHEVDDGARIVEDAGEKAPWASGAVGMYGASYPGGTQILTATGPDRDRLESLRAIVPVAPAASYYEVVNHDGVPHFLSAPGQTLVYLALLANPGASPEHLPERPGCVPEQFDGTAVPTGDYNAFYEERDHSRHLDRLEAATLMVHGNADRRVTPMMQSGLFDGISDTTPRAGLFGVWDHELPRRGDWDAMVVAWFERHLLGVRNGADRWPVAQVQGTDGQWRTASEWPAVPGPERQLRLGGGGVLGTVAAAGETFYLEAPVPELEADGLPTDVPGTAAAFTTAPLPERLELIGSPVVDLWVRLLQPDSHVTVRLEVIDADGRRLTPESRTVGARSAQHLEPLIGGSRFRQRSGVPAPTGVPLLVPVRLDPVDLVAPAGSRLRLTVAGSSIVYDGLDGVTPGLGAVFQGPTWPAGVPQPVAILHDAAHPSALRFTTPEPNSLRLAVADG